MATTNQITPATNTVVPTNQITPATSGGGTGGFLFGFGVLGGGSIAGSSGTSVSNTNVRQIDSSLTPSSTVTPQIAP